MRNNKTVLITGASSGIGYELAKLFAKEGYNLILTARRLERLNKLKSDLEKDISDIIKHHGKEVALYDLYPKLLRAIEKYIEKNS